MTQINWQYQVNNRAGGYIVTNTDWNDVAGDLRAFIDQTTGSGTTDNTPLPIGIDLVNDRVYISDPDSTTPEDGNHADTTLSVVGTTTLTGNTQQTGTLNVGVDDTGFDVKFHGATAGKSWLWDESGDTMFVTGGTLLYGDLTVGVDDTGYDVQFFGATASAYMKWDQANDDLVLAGAAGLDIAGDVDIDGTTNLDEVDIDGAVDIGNHVTISGAYDLDIGNSGSQILGPASGSAAAPSYAFKGDAGLGIFRSNTDVMHLATAGATRMTWTAAGHVGIGSDAPAQKFLVYAAEGWDSGNFIALIENADTDSGSGNVLQLKGGATTGDTSSKMLDVLDIGGTTEFFVRGDGVTYLRNASKDAGTFDIPHPVKGGDWRLRHSLVEAPRADLIYRGTTTLSGGTATIDLDADSNMTDGTWEVLNRNPWSMVASSGNAVTWSLSGKTLTINSNTADAVCSWIVIGERQDPTIKDSRTRFFDDDGHLIVEAEDANMPGSETFAANETTA